jgi:hypothetical protein
VDVKFVMVYGFLDIVSIAIKPFYLNSPRGKVYYLVSFSLSEVHMLWNKSVYKEHV